MTRSVICQMWCVSAMSNQRPVDVSASGGDWHFVQTKVQSQNVFIGSSDVAVPHLSHSVLYYYYINTTNVITTTPTTTTMSNNNCHDNSVN